jgi:hypothetical protein
VSGTDDDMCKQELFLPVLDQLTSHDVHWIEGGNHGMDIKGKPIDDIVRCNGYDKQITPSTKSIMVLSQQTATADLDPIDRPVIYDTLIDRCLIPDYHIKD